MFIENKVRYTPAIMKGSNDSVELKGFVACVLTGTEVVSDELFQSLPLVNHSSERFKPTLEILIPKS